MESIEEINSLSDYILAVKELHSYLKDGDHELYFRGQKQRYLKEIRLTRENEEEKIESILPSLFRKETLLNHENKLYEDFLMRAPNLFAQCNNNFERLALMQHHQLPTRLLDLTANPLIALYFACDASDNDGVIYPFSNNLNFKIFKENLEFKGKQNVLSDFRCIEKDGFAFPERRISINKTAFSDEIELESTIVRLSFEDKISILTELSRFFACRSEQLEKNPKSESWNSLYYRSRSEGSLDNIYEYRLSFKENTALSHLYHMVANDVGIFKQELNPIEMYLPKIIKAREIDRRIKNQKGLFLFVPFVGDINYTRQDGAWANYYGDKIWAAQNSINSLRLFNNNGKLISFTIPKDKKTDILTELEEIGIDRTFIYPDDYSILSKQIEEKY
ncbi:FRG domain-containing protein [Limosilactobacillus reuteri]|uniref:FRG domain-containing protein n=1 Tax=Limosilactobacillus reuteri TaxID=1598 RepID=UPI001E637768|nr:FRG domain-containing protein [Limosilactobacillus reuteri]MCC4398008.1 FRG domain-containing protein [Limosilactobacillus reuteri]MCC4410147.1 FRG domain-containing protein [Limosilactobacillus reuteri]